jgi:hypothetical protein
MVEPVMAHVFCLIYGEAKRVLGHATFSSPFGSGLSVVARGVRSTHLRGTPQDVFSRWRNRSLSAQVAQDQRDISAFLQFAKIISSFVCWEK